MVELNAKENTAEEAKEAKAEATPQTTAAAKSRAKKNTKRQVASGRTYVKATYNNTVVTFTDLNGNTLVQYSAGQAGFKGPKKSTPYAATIIIERAAEKLKAYGLKEVSVFVKGVGGGREAAIRALNANGINVTSIKDITPIPHNGCRSKKPRRV
ncbi:MAG: 30S ribosomal protein S11 [Patescibacteria group bacterium]|jgi:small subunit ribosomal protein S11